MRLLTIEDQEEMDFIYGILPTYKQTGISSIIIMQIVMQIADVRMLKTIMVDVD